MFQSHRYTRFQDLWADFKTSFEGVDALFVTDVYSASEDNIDGISGENFATDLEGAQYISGSMEDVGCKLLPTLKRWLKP